MTDVSPVSSTMVYSDATSRFQALVRDALPRDATVAVVSRGDADLVSLDGLRAWHFPQRGDGVYLGYYPADSVAAIQHLEALRGKGAEFLAIPASSFWWLEHYTEFARHLTERYELVLRDESACAVYALVQRDEARGERIDDAVEATGAPVDDLSRLPERLREDARALFDSAWYSEQAATTFGSFDEALTHYLELGHLEDLTPHPLFDARWYAVRHPQARDAGTPALLHFVEHGAGDTAGPSPWFDVEHYYAQLPGLREQGVNALVHYVANAAEGRACNPNPLFRDGYYLRTYPDVRESGMSPLEHFLRIGRAQGRHVSHIHQNIVERLRQTSARSLTRGNWKIGTALIFGSGALEGIDAAALADRLASDYRIDATCVTLRRGPERGDGEGDRRELLVLEDYELACDVMRPSALRTLAAALCVQGPLLAISELPEVVETVADLDVPTFFLADDAAVDAAAKRARRVVVPSSAAARAARRRGASVSVCAPGDGRMAALAKLVARELRIPRQSHATRSSVARKIVIPCSDWNVSGVNAALEAAGEQLVDHGWEVEIVFTRDRDTVLASAGDEVHLPSLPYRFLERTHPGVDGMWEALISDVERSGPCILFLAYDFIGNCVVPALSDDIGVVLWVQADDGDYYEQAYRLGRYCNAVVCVSSHIRDTVAALNPAIGERSHVIHNSSVRADEIIRRRPRQASRMRLVYAGRLVQYQKRILDYIDLARALDRSGLPYEMTLIGSFVAYEGSQPLFEKQAREHLDDGRIRLPGRMSRTQILDELGSHPFFVLLSDFEGLPLALVEAMARGCVPVVAESESGIPELVTHGHDGFIVGGRDYDRWAELLAELWEDRPALTRMSRQARRTVLDRFTVEAIGDQFHELLSGVAQEIASGYRRPPALHWGVDRSHTGDVLPAPSLYRSAGLGSFPGLA
jgi:glycosyltransferase involved in cell wall biosynthesis